MRATVVISSLIFHFLRTAAVIRERTIAEQIFRAVAAVSDDAFSVRNYLIRYIASVQRKVVA